MSRIIFKSKIVRREFFEKVLKKSLLKTWKTLYETNKIPRSVFDEYKNGRTSTPYDLYEKLSTYFNRKEKEYFSKKIKLLENNWGRIKGGKENYRKNEKIFEEGRRLGLKKLIELNQKIVFDVNKIQLDKSLAYFIGLWIGDGFTSGYKNHYLTQFIGHTSEISYYQETVCKYIEETFNLKPKIKKSLTGNFIRVNIYSKNLFELLINKLALPPGRKSHTIFIPEYILNSKKEILFSCIAGIYDAEGNVFVDKREIYSKPYLRIGLHMINQKIMSQIKNVLDSEGIITSWANLSKDNTRFLIYGEKNIRKFLLKIPIKNPKHINKLKGFNLL